MTRLVRQMLDMASADALFIPAGAMANLGAIAVEVAGQLTPLAAREGRSIRFLDKKGSHSSWPQRGHKPCCS